MNILFCIFLILASLVCLATLTWVAIDITISILERKKKTAEMLAVIVEEEPEKEIVEEPEEEIVEEPEEEIVEGPEEEIVEGPEEEIVEGPEEEIVEGPEEEIVEEPKKEIIDEPEKEIVEEPEEEIVEEVEEIIKEEALIPETVTTDIVVEQDTASVEVIDIVWDEHIGKNKTYRYAPNGFEVGKGDIVLVPTFSSQKHGEIARKATVHSDIYKIDPAELKYHLKPVLRVMQKAAPAANVAETPAD